MLSNNILFKPIFFRMQRLSLPPPCAVVVFV
jgi:hypothetical protein